MRRRLPAVLALAVLAACAPSTSADPTPSTPSPPATSSPATPDPSTDPLYLEAVEVYKAYFAEMSKSEVAGYPEPTLPARYDKYLMGDMKNAVAAAWSDSHAAGVRIDRPAQLASVSPIVGVKHGRSIVAIRACSDATHSRVLDTQDQDQGPGAAVSFDIYFSRDGQLLKGMYSDAKEVKSCGTR